MKKVLTTMLIVAVAMTMVFAKGGNETVSESGALSGNITWGVASLGSSAQMVASAIGTVMTEQYPGVQVSVQATAGSNENVRLLKGQEIHIANVNDGYNASTGKGAYEGEEPAKLWGLFNMYTNAYIVCVPEKSSIKAIDDLIGKKVNLGPKGSGVYNAAHAMLEAHGVVDKITIATYGYNDANDALKSGVIDALVGLVSGEIPSPALQQLDTSTKVRVIPIDTEKAKSAYAKYPDYASGKLHAGCMNCITTDMDVFAGFTVEYADERLSDELAYTLVKTVYENVEKLKAYHQIAGTLDPNTALDGIPSNIPVHPGAAKYYKEIGVWRDTLTVGTR